MDSDDTQDALAGPMLALDRQLLRAYLEGLRSDNPRARRKAARGLAGLGAIAREAVPALEQALADRDRSVREGAARALARIRSAP